MKKTVFLTAVFIFLYFCGLLFITAQEIKVTFMGAIQELLTLPLLVILVLLWGYLLRMLFRAGWKWNLQAGSFVLCLATTVLLVIHSI